ncbi:MAG: cysteine protease StiP family protein [Eubacteriales bacterium]|nr:cysteine protease StiP family protein [Eubacteriales bacterium]
MRSSYSEEDVILLLKDITGLVEPQSTKERERQIQSGRHYCEMLPIEYVPSGSYMEAYREALKHYARPTAAAVEQLARKVMDARGKNVVLVSLARAGIPIGILLKRCIYAVYGVRVPHYSISIIRGRGIDQNAMKYLLARHPAGDLLFVDGWIGKGAILNELRAAVSDWPGVSPELAVAADPANVTALCGTHEDILIPSSCLNSTVSGLISRTFLRDDIIGPDDFHGAVYYENLRDSDLSYEFIHAIEAEFSGNRAAGGDVDGQAVHGVAGAGHGELAEDAGAQALSGGAGMRLCEPADDAGAPVHGVDEVRAIAARFGVDDINLVKPGIGEATRVLLRRVPWKVLAAENALSDPALTHILRLAGEKGVPVEPYPLVRYKACGIIKKLADA